VARPKPPKVVYRKVSMKQPAKKGPTEGGLRYRPTKPKVGGNTRNLKS
jgi:hypothetical protein